MVRKKTFVLVWWSSFKGFFLFWFFSSSSTLDLHFLKGRSLFWKLQVNHKKRLRVHGMTDRSNFLAVSDEWFVQPNLLPLTTVNWVGS